MEFMFTEGKYPVVAYVKGDDIVGGTKGDDIVTISGLELYALSIYQTWDMLEHEDVMTLHCRKAAVDKSAASGALPKKHQEHS